MHGETCVFVVGMIAGVCGLGWPAKKIVVGHVVFWKPDLGATVDDVRFLYVLDVSEWRGVSYQWTSMLGQAVAGAGDLQQGMLARALHDHKPLLEVCALQAFHTLPKSALQTLCKHLKCPDEIDNTLCSLLTKLLRMIIPDISDDALFRILEKRVSNPSLLEDVAVSGDLVEDAGEKDEKEVIDLQAEVKQTITRAEDFCKQLREFKQKVQEAKPKLAAGKKKGAKVDPPAGPRLPVKPPKFVDDSTEEYVASYLPPDFRLWRDAFCKRWQLTHMGSKYLSMSWGKHGYVESAHALLSKSWERHVQLGGAAAPWPLPKPDRPAGARVEGMPGSSTDL